MRPTVLKPLLSWLICQSIQWHTTLRRMYWCVSGLHVMPRMTGALFSKLLSRNLTESRYWVLRMIMSFLAMLAFVKLMIIWWSISFGLSMKSDVAKFCKSCHACQIAGKPNQVVPPAPLKPIPVLGEPFERILIDCVGPLPKTKSGNSYLLTLMCVSTRFPEAIPLRSLKAHAIVKAIIKFCTTFGMPKYIQSDQGTNFMSRVFVKVMKQLNIKHQVSSAYHSQSQVLSNVFIKP